MSSDTRIQLRHPAGKRAPSARDRYTLVRRLMLATVPAKEPGIIWVRLRSVMDRKLGKKLARVGETPQRLVRTSRR